MWGKVSVEDGDKKSIPLDKSRDVGIAGVDRADYTDPACA